MTDSTFWGLVIWLALSIGIAAAWSLTATAMKPNPRKRRIRAQQAVDRRRLEQAFREPR